MKVETADSFIRMSSALWRRGARGFFEAWAMLETIVYAIKNFAYAYTEVRGIWFRAGGAGLLALILTLAILSR